MAMLEEVREELCGHIIPFWKKLRDDEYGGYYGLLDFDLKLDKKAEKGCILNNRITWFFSNAYLYLKDEALLEEARHGYRFLKDHCLDRKYGGVYWSMSHDGKALDTTKHTYNQAFCIYALASYYDASGEREALEEAYGLFDIIETKCRDEGGYLEAFDREFRPASNEKLSENGVMAERTMNTLLHVFEAYTELYRVDHNEKVGACLRWIMDCFAEKMYNPALHRQEVFFDHEYHTLIDLYSYGHDIETSWLLDRGLEVLGDEAYAKKLAPITMDLARNVKATAFDGHSLANECDKGVVNTDRIWWVQAETLIGFINAYQKDPSRTDFLEAARAEWDFIKTYSVDHREGSEWFYAVTAEGAPDEQKRPIVEPWKCPYHNGRMCIEVLRRNVE
ncbi:MAG: AGE family epimerase/isomerase [Lachnospiraceae bacterium]|nr:AGE family epimerase/isomerase [Lachnospiraceae bacterium]